MDEQAEEDLGQVGATPAMRSVLETLKDEGHVKDLVDAYRLCIALACAWNVEPNSSKSKNMTTMFAVNTLDTRALDLRIAVSELYPEWATSPYRACQSLAEQGAAILKEEMAGTSVSFADLVGKSEQIGSA